VRENQRSIAHFKLNGLNFHLDAFHRESSALPQFRPADMLSMSVAALQQSGQNLPAWMALVMRGESVAIVDD
jgi:hypothetical protein